MNDDPAHRPGENATSVVRVEFHASKLRSAAFRGGSNPYAIVTLLANRPNEEPQVLGQTEVIKNTQNPRWTTAFEVEYAIGKSTRLNVGVYDQNRNKEKPMGSAMFEIGEVLGTRANTKAKVLRNGGTLFCRVTPLRAIQGTNGQKGNEQQTECKLQLGFRGIKLKNVDGLFGKSDPFFELSAQINTGSGTTWNPVYRSLQIDNNLNPIWEPLEIPIDRLCGQEVDLDKPIQFSLWDWQKSGKHQPMGSFVTTVNAMINSVVDDPEDTSKAFIPTRRKKEYGKIVITKAKMKGELLGTFVMNGFFGQRGSEEPSNRSVATRSQSVTLPSDSEPIHPGMAGRSRSVGQAAPDPYAQTDPYNAQPSQGRPSFVDYLTGGCELEACIAIDFTGSNGDPRVPGTLHYVHKDGQLNDYEKAITAVGKIIARYDSDQSFPVWGFGAKYNNKIRHCFQVGPEPELQGLKGVLDGYRSVFHTRLVMSGPTIFAEVIRLAANTARQRQQEAKAAGSQCYRILLILTDGAVSDVEGTKRALHEASDAPLSVVIVGIGNADFGEMQSLDDFQSLNTPDGEVFCGGRDICNFVEFNRFRNDKSALTKQVLEEIPDQMVDYFYSRGIMPLPPVSENQTKVNPSQPTDEDIDLSMDFSREGEIRLANNRGAVYDDTQYDTMSSFGAYVPPESAAGQPVAPKFFHVQVPEGAMPGTEIEITHPVTQEILIVIVPDGLAPGSLFAVQC